ncbi:hypothetical protein H7F37_00805 [Winogradskyella sp. PAMC22761]|nr:hypothetical protein H7F37_00805 [Winogradskyella sp. PAMC22761]
MLLIIGLSLYTNCYDSDDTQLEFESTETISRHYVAACIYFGGLIINIDGKESDKQFDELPQNSNIDLQNTTFPFLSN